MINEDDFEEQIEDLILENGMLTQALINLLTRKGILSEQELASEVESLYGNEDDGEAAERGVSEFGSGEAD